MELNGIFCDMAYHEQIDLSTNQIVGVLPTQNWFNPNILFIKDDFYAGSTASSTIGELSWLFSASVSTCAVQTNTNKPGVISIVSGVGPADRGALNLQNLASFQFGLGNVTYNTYVKLIALSDVTTTYKTYIGFYDDLTMAGSGEGVYFSYTDSENSGNWTLNTSTANAVNTTADSGVPATTNWVQLGFVCTGTTSVEFFINGVSVGSISNTMPGTSDLTTSFYGMIKSLGIGQPALYIDLYTLQYDLTTPRFV